jgi:hypothetical protein
MLYYPLRAYRATTRDPSPPASSAHHPAVENVHHMWSSLAIIDRAVPRSVPGQVACIPPPQPWRRLKPLRPPILSAKHLPNLASVLTQASGPATSHPLALDAH